jgi:hypothetical protein
VIAVKRSPDLNDLQWVVDDLILWSYWVGGNIWIAWPTDSLLYRIVREGAAAVAGSRGLRSVKEWPEGVAQIEQSVLSLPREERDAVMAKYLIYGWNDKQRAKELGMSVYSFRKILGIAYRHIAEKAQKGADHGF